MKLRIIFLFVFVFLFLSCSKKTIKNIVPEPEDNLFVMQEKTNEVQISSINETPEEKTKEINLDLIVPYFGTYLPEPYLKT